MTLRFVRTAGLCSEEYSMGHGVDETSVTNTNVELERDQVVDDGPANAGLSTGGGSNTSNNVDESALQNLNVRLCHSKIGRGLEWMLIIRTLGG